MSKLVLFLINKLKMSRHISYRLALCPIFKLLLIVFLFVIAEARLQPYYKRNRDLQRSRTKKQSTYDYLQGKGDYSEIEEA